MGKSCWVKSAQRLVSSFWQIIKKYISFKLKVTPVIEGKDCHMKLAEKEHNCIFLLFLHWKRTIASILSGWDTEDAVTTCSYPEVGPPYLPPASSPKGSSPFFMSSHSDSISWGLSLPPQSSRVISSFSSASGVRAAYRDCANPNTAGWKGCLWALLPSSLLPTEATGALEPHDQQTRIKQDKQLSLP